MKVLLVINSSDNGGANKMIVTLYNEMKRHYPESKIVFLWKIPSQYSEIEGAYYFRDTMSSAGDYIKAYKELYRVVKAEKPDALISFLPLANIMTAIVGKKLGIKTRIASQRNPPQIYGKVVRMLDRFIGSRGYYTANVCNSKAGMDAFADYPESYKKHLSVINNCVEAPDLSISKENAAMQMGIPANVTVLTCVGRLHEQKNHEVIVKAMKYVDNAHLYLGGDGPLRNEITALIKAYGVGDKITMLGDLNRDQVRTLLRATDAFLIPSKYEGLSNSLIEAMAYGLPIVCSNIPSFTDFLKLKDDESYAAVVINNSDEQEWAQGISKLITDKTAMKKYAERSLQQVAELTPEQMTLKFSKLLIP